MNRPVHLARRDACVTRAAEMLHASSLGRGVASRSTQVERLERLLACAVEHATLATRSGQGSETETALVRFLRLVHHNAQSVQALMANQAHIESENHNFLARLLGEDQEEAALSALHCRRSAEDMLLGLRQILQMAYGPLVALQRTSLEKMNDADRERYKKAHASFTDEMANRFPLEPETPSGQPTTDG